ncbi:hypothetical protein ACHAW5_011139 [Stephanodiscus triporus]|uniref:Trichohyalin-plectin-homology domain-containing protein n=1 Tax=Stephanodiscus triporus TaxID=2934178 RepID=A0ABD3QV14_9STRA
MEISRKELDRIASSVGSQSNTESCDITRKERLKQLSDSRVAEWNDTLAAKSKARLEWKKDKTRQEEEQRRLQDAEDAERRQISRKDALENAEKLLREQTEKVRQFRQQQMLVETLDTRDGQLKEQEDKRKKETAMEELWHKAVMDDIQKAEKTSKQEMDKDKQRSMELAMDLRRQRDEREERIREQQRRKQEEEGRIIQKIAVDDLSAEKAEMELKIERMIKAKESMEKNKLLLKQRQEEISRQEVEETKKCEEEVAKRNKISLARADLEKKHFEQINATRKMLSDKASEELKKMAKKECEIFDRDVKLRSEKEKEMIATRNKKLEQDRIDVEESRQQQLRSKVQDAEAEKKLGDLYAEELARKATAQQESEHQKQLEKRKQNIGLRKIQLDQIRENERRVAIEKANALKEEQQVFHELKKEEDIFKDFVTKEIENFKVQGKRTILLEKTLQS